MQSSRLILYYQAPLRGASRFQITFALMRHPGVRDERNAHGER
jgi:hypothetical protein